MNSLIQTEKHCLVCGTTQNLHKHHIYFGAYRNKSDRWGCWCWLCADHHTGPFGVHSANGKELNYTLKRVCQRAFVEKYDIDTFMKVFGRNYEVD